MDKILDFVFKDDIKRNRFCVIYKYRFLKIIPMRGIELFNNLNEAKKFASKYEEFEIRGR